MSATAIFNSNLFDVSDKYLFQWAGQRHSDDDGQRIPAGIGDGMDCRGLLRAFQEGRTSLLGH